MDVYLIDQLFKGRLHENSSVLDAGCGSGRNSIPLLHAGWNVTMFDSKEQDFGQYQSCFGQNSIEENNFECLYDFIICNAVLHFSESHEHFNLTFKKLQSLLNPSGILFIRMASSIGIDSQTSLKNGLHHLKDGSTRYLISRERITELCEEHQLKLIEPVKSTLVEDLRSMATVVFQKLI